jgi:hypothetical protein
MLLPVVEKREEEFKEDALLRSDLFSIALFF